MPDSNNNGPPLRNDVLTLGLNMAVGMVVFTLLGNMIDEKRGGGTGFTLAGIFLGLFYGGYEVWKIIRKQKDS